MPSLASKVTLASSIFITGGIIVGVHYFQFDERQQLRKGIKLDIERQEAKRAENWRRLEEQKELTKSFRRIEQEERNNKSES